MAILTAKQVADACESAVLLVDNACMLIRVASAGEDHPMRYEHAVVMFLGNMGRHFPAVTGHFKTSHSRAELAAGVDVVKSQHDLR